MKRYLQLVAALTVLICLAVAAFNYVVDPYGIYRLASADSKRLSRIDQFYFMRLSKPRLLPLLKPDAVIVGTSRSSTIKPQHPAWQGNRGYNLAVPGMTVYETLRFVEHAHASGPLKKLMIGLDFQAFMTAEPPLRIGLTEQRLARTSHDLRSIAYWRQSATDIADTLLSLAALSRSAAALSGNGNTAQRKYFPDGTWATTSRTVAGKAGYVFMGSDRLATHRNNAFQSGKNMSLFADLLRFCHRQKIDTRLFVTPIHVFMVDVWQQLGYAQQWRNFHQQLVAVNEAVANEVGEPPFKLVGFNNARGIVDEPIDSGGKSDAAWFHDGVHFRYGLGDAIMRSVWGNNESFGTVLNNNTVTPYLAAVDALTNSFLARQPGLVTDIQQRICDRTPPLKATHDNARKASDSFCGKAKL